MHTDAFFFIRSQSSQFHFFKSLHRYSVLSISYRTGRQIFLIQQISLKHTDISNTNKSCKLTYIFTIWIVTGARQFLSELGKWKLYPGCCYYKADTTAVWIMLTSSDHIQRVSYSTRCREAVGKNLSSSFFVSVLGPEQYIPV